MKNAILQGSLAFAISCVTAGVLLAQPPPPSTPQPPPTSPQRPTTAPQPSDDNRDRMVTATGCLKQEKDVAGARPNVAERAGVGEDFILTQARLQRRPWSPHE
jgi:hypothetical protein